MGLGTGSTVYFTLVRIAERIAQEGLSIRGVPTSIDTETKAREMGIATIGLAGGDGGEMARAGLDHLLVVPTGSIHRVQECHLAAYHILWDLTHTLLANDRAAPLEAGA